MATRAAGGQTGRSRRGNHEGSITQRRDGRWMARLTLPDGRRRAVYARTKREALEKLQALRLQVAQGFPAPAGRLTVGQFLENWAAGLDLRVRPRTAIRYRELVRLHLTPRLGRVPLAQLTPQHVEQALAAMVADGVAPRTAGHARAVLRNALTSALRQGLVGRNAAALAAPPKVQEREVRALAPADARAILAAVQGDRLAALFTVGLALGLRLGEALGLLWSDLDLETGTLRVERTLQRVAGTWRFLPPKTARARRTIPLPGPVAAALREHRARQLEERLRAGAAWEGDRWGDLVFADELGRPLSGFHVRRRLQALLAVAGLPPMRYHDLRHGAASLMAAHGVPVRVAMELLGHAQVSTTMEIYAHVAPEWGREAAARIAAALWDEG